MKATVSEKIFCFLFLLLFAGGCVAFQQPENTLSAMQQAVRSRLLKFQATEFLAQTARERFQSEKAVTVFTLKTGYKETWNVETDPALEVLEEAIRYGLTVAASDPQGTAEKVTGAKLDFMTSCKLLKLKHAAPSARRDHLAELELMTGWERKKIEQFANLPLEAGEIAPFHIDLASERLLDEKGNAAAFDLAADLYRHTNEARLRQAERFRRAMLNRYLLQIKSSGNINFPELKTALWRGRLFSEFFKEL